jgi:hypothetical protein
MTACMLLRGEELRGRGEGKVLGVAQLRAEEQGEEGSRRRAELGEGSRRLETCDGLRGEMMICNARSSMAETRPPFCSDPNPKP